MSFSAEDIAGMLAEYKADQNAVMDVEEMGRLIYDYTGGYPFLVSRICQLMDEKAVSQEDGSGLPLWTEKEVLAAGSFFQNRIHCLTIWGKDCQIQKN